MNQKINVLNENGEAIEAEVLLSFNLAKTGKSYILYTFDEKDDQNMETIHASIVSKDSGRYKLEVMPDDDWEIVKDIMRQIIRNKGE